MFVCLLPPPLFVFGFYQINGIAMHNVSVAAFKEAVANGGTGVQFVVQRLGQAQWDKLQESLLERQSWSLSVSGSRRQSAVSSTGAAASAAEDATARSQSPRLRTARPHTIFVPKARHGDAGFSVLVWGESEEEALPYVHGDVSRAAADQGLGPGMFVQAVNGRSTVGLSQDQVEALLRQAPSPMELVVARDDDAYGTAAAAMSIVGDESSASVFSQLSRRSRMSWRGTQASVVRRTVTREHGRLGLGIVSSPAAGSIIGEVEADRLRDAGIEEGQELVAVNGTDVHGLEHGEVLRLLHDAGDTVQLVLRETAAMPPAETVVVRKHQGRFGFQIASKVIDGMRALFVTSVANPTAQGRLLPNMRVLSLNGTDLSRADAAKLRSVLSTLRTDQVTLEVVPPATAREQLQRHVTRSGRSGRAARSGDGRLQRRGSTSSMVGVPVRPFGSRGVRVQAFSLTREDGKLGVGIVAPSDASPMGVLVLSVTSSTAARAGVKPGMRVLAVNGTDVQHASRDQAVQVIGAASEPIVLKCAVFPRTRKVRVSRDDFKRTHALVANAGGPSAVFVARATTADPEQVPNVDLTEGDRVLFVDANSTALASQGQ